MFHGYNDSPSASGATGIYLVNSAGVVVASASFTVDNLWQTVEVVYTLSSTNTWVVSWKGSVVISYSDAQNAAWVAASGPYWGIGADAGGATGDFYIQKVALIPGVILSHAIITVQSNHLRAVFTCMSY